MHFPVPEQCRGESHLQGKSTDLYWCSPCQYFNFLFKTWMKKRMYCKGQKDFTSICLSQPVINPVAGLWSQSFNWRSKWPHHRRGGCSHPSFTLPTGLVWSSPHQSLSRTGVAIQNESQEDWARQFRWGERDWNREPDYGCKPWACQEGHKEQEGWKRRGSAHVTNK